MTKFFETMMMQQPQFMAQIQDQVQSIRQIALTRSRSTSPDRRAEASTADRAPVASEGAGVQGFSQARASPSTSEVFIETPVTTQRFDIGTPPHPSGFGPASPGWNPPVETLACGADFNPNSSETPFSRGKSAINPDSFGNETSRLSHGFSRGLPPGESAPNSSV